MAKHDKAPDPEKSEPLPEGLRAEDFNGAAPPLVFESDTLSGDVRDMLLTHLRSAKVPWAMLNEQEQADKIDACRRCGEDVVRQVVQAVVKAGFPSIVVSVGAIKIDKGVEIKLGASSSVDTITLLAEHGKGAAVLVLAEASDFYGERQPQKADKNQPDLPLDAGD